VDTTLPLFSYSYSYSRYYLLFGGRFDDALSLSLSLSLVAAAASPLFVSGERRVEVCIGDNANHDVECFLILSAIISFFLSPYLFFGDDDDDYNDDDSDDESC